MSLVLDLHISHDRFGSRSDPSLNGHLHYPNDIDNSLNETVSHKIRKYRSDYNNNPPTVVSFIPPVTSTSGDYIVNSYDFYSYSLIGKLTAFLQLQEFSLRNKTVDSSTSTTRISLNISKSGPIILTNFSSINLVFIFRCSSSPSNPVSERHVVSSALVFSLSSHRHSEMGFIFSSHFYRFTINKKKRSRTDRLSTEVLHTFSSRFYRFIINNTILSVAVDTSGLIYDDFSRLLFLHSNYEESALANEIPEELAQFRFLRATCYVNIKGSVGLNLAKTSCMRISIPFDLLSRSSIPLQCFIRSTILCGKILKNASNTHEPNSTCRCDMEKHKTPCMYVSVYPSLGDPRVWSPNLLDQMWEHVRSQVVLQIVHVRGYLSSSNSPKVTTRISCFLEPKFEKDQKWER